jgi:CRISPR-associated protein Cmr6
MTFDRPKPKGSGNNQPPTPSPWLKGEKPAIATDTFVSFVEYLRWMREPGHPQKDPTKVEILQLAAEKATSYRQRLQELTDRTKTIAGKDNCFEATSSWRLRVGGHRGPESILLPAFDALGIPYIPSSTLRGVARERAIRHFMAEGKNYEEAIEAISLYFGSLNAKNSKDRQGKVIFLDAYPLPSSSDKLAVDMANNIWQWDGNKLDYRPNPNPFLSLKQPTLLIGIKPMPQCDSATFDRVKTWLKEGLQAGIGSQINSGYGQVKPAGNAIEQPEILRVYFKIEGQLIHGRQKFTEWKWKEDKNKYETRGKPDAEVRPIAFKSMLRYWFRSIAMGVLPTSVVKEFEAKLFGSIQPQTRGWLTVRIENGKLDRKEAEKREDDCGMQSGTLAIQFSTEIPSQQKESVQKLMKNLTWMMFSLGSIGQGARRPYYSRQNRENAPWWRGSSIFPEGLNGDNFWTRPEDASTFQKRFQERLKDFYNALGTVTGEKIPSSPLSIKDEDIASSTVCAEAMDSRCLVIVCSGDEINDKPHALAILHDRSLKKNGNYDPDLCGTVKGEAKPSPVWVANLIDYQVVTIFRSDVDPRKKYVTLLKKSSDKYCQIFPL